MAVVVTGAAGHIGSEIASALIGAGREVVLVDADAQRLDLLVSRLGAAASGISADVTDPGANRALVDEAVARAGGVEACVAAAGIEGPVAPIEDLSAEDVEAVFRVNALAVFWLASAIVPVFKSQGSGRFVPVASGAGLAGGALTSPYNASKHAVVGLTRSLARELAPSGIAVNAVCPGYVDSPMVDRIAEAEGRLTGVSPDYVGTIPAGRMAGPEEVASVVKYLVCDAPDYLTGTCMVLDGALRA